MRRGDHNIGRALYKLTTITQICCQPSDRHQTAKWCNADYETMCRPLSQAQLNHICKYPKKWCLPNGSYVCRYLEQRHMRACNGRVHYENAGSTLLVCDVLFPGAVLQFYASYEHIFFRKKQLVGFLQIKK